MRVRRQQHLTSVPSRENATGPVEYRPEVIAAARLYLPDVNGHADAQWSRFAPVRGGEPALDLARRGEGGSDIGEGKIDAVADTLDNAPSGRLHRCHDDAVMLGDRGAHRARVHLPKNSRVLYVGEQKGERLHLQLGLKQQRTVLVEDPPLQLLELRRRLEPQLVSEVHAGLLVRAQRLRLSPAAVEGEHVLGAEPLVDGELLAQHLQLGDELRVLAEP